MRGIDTARSRRPVILQAVGAAVALALAGPLVSGWALGGTEESHHGAAADGSMVHDGVRYYAGPVPDALPAGALEGMAPAAIGIPGIGVRSELVHLGITSDGRAEVPEDYGVAGWFSGGGRPGWVGPTVILGHVDSSTGPAVFYRLRDLAPGDVVEVTTASGTLARYVVERTEQVSKDEFPTFAVFGATQQDVLRLVTCAGEFDRGERSYTDNFVVHATRTG
jgi:sortase (surface protein transpeptidase)